MLKHFATAGAICLGLGLTAAPAAAQSSYASVSTSATVAGLSPVYSIRNVQQALNRLGYSAGTPDGKVGPNTRGAVRDYQAANGLPITGEPSAALYDRLLASVAGGAQAQAQSAYSVQPSRDLVTAMQSELRQRGYAIGAITGELDAETRQAIMQYQTDAGMTITGQPSQSLLSHMRTASVERRIDRRQTVMNIQEALNRRGYDAGPADGALGPKTRSAIRTYQSDAGLPITGEPSETLLASLNGESGQAADDSDRDAERGLVRDIQTELKQRGFYAGAVNGKLNRRTREAIDSYQAAMRMPQTGEPSLDLLASLRISDRGQGGVVAPKLVRDVERALKDRGYEIGRTDGILDADTSAAIRAYQRDAGLPIDGRPSDDLLAHIAGSDVRASGYGTQYPVRQFFQNLGESRQ